MGLRFAKMHGQGNDFVVIDGVRQAVSLSREEVRAIADRHFGVGCDQLLLVEKAASPENDFRYRIFNADGGEVEQCGNGARCFARFVLDAALDPTALPGDLGRRLARRAGVFRSPAVSVRTTVLLLRHRVHLTLPGREQVRSLVAEDAEIVAFTGRPEEPAWLPPAAVEELLAAPAAATGADRLTADALDRARNQVAVLAPALGARGDALADRLLADHLRVRATAGGMARRGLTVEPIRPADVLGLYLYLPAVPA